MKRSDVSPAGDVSGVDDDLDVAPEGREAPTGHPPLIRADQRVAAIGMTGSGKSKLLAKVWSASTRQRVLVDVNDDYELGPAALADKGGWCEAERVREIDWTKRTIHFVPRAQGEQVYNDLFAAIFDRRDVDVWLDESSGPTSATKSPRWLRTTVTQGRKRRIRMLAAMQEPMNVLPVLYSQAEHVLVMRLGLRPADLRQLGLRMRMAPDELAAAIEQLPEYAYLHSVLGQDTIWRQPPLSPAELRLIDEHVRWPA